MWCTVRCLGGMCTHTCSCKACICFVDFICFLHVFFCKPYVLCMFFFNSISFLYVFFFWFYTFFIYFSATHIFFWKSICLFCDSICVICDSIFFCDSYVFVIHMFYLQSICFLPSSYVIWCNEWLCMAEQIMHHLHYFPAHTPPHHKCHDCAWQWEKISS